MGVRHFSVIGVTSESEEACLYEAHRDEIIRFGGILAFNNAELIRNGIAQKVILQFAGERAVDAYTQFQVSHIGNYLRNGKWVFADVDPANVGVNVLYGMQHGAGGVTSMALIGRRIPGKDGGELLSVEPGFSEEDVIRAGELLDIIDENILRGLLPNIDTYVFDSIHVNAAKHNSTTNYS